MFAESGGKRYAGVEVGQLRIWHERQSLGYELNKLDDASLSDFGFARAQIPNFVSVYPIAGELLALMLERLEQSGNTAPMLRWTYEDLLRPRPMCNEHCTCEDRQTPGPSAEGDKGFCSNAWVLDQLRRSHYPHAFPFFTRAIWPYSERQG